MESSTQTDDILELVLENLTLYTTFEKNDSLFISSSTTAPTHFIVVTTSVEFLPWGLGLLIICFLGIIGNVLSAAVLLRPRMKSTYSTLSLGLTFCDTVYFSTKFFRYGLQSMFLHFGIAKGYTDIFFPWIGPEIRAVNFIASTGTTYMTIAVAVDRYLAVCWPFHARKFCSRKKALRMIVMVILFANVYNLPRWWEFRTEVNYTVPNENDPQSVTTYYKMSQLPFRNNLAYKTYYIFWAYFFIMFLIPFVSLCTFNYLIFRVIRLATAMREKLTSRQKDENSFAVMLLAVVVVFLICSCVFPILDIVNFAGYKYPKIFDHIGNVMLTLNSAINFILYYLFGRRFRQECIALWYQIRGKKMPLKKGYNFSLSGASRRTTTAEITSD